MISEHVKENKNTMWNDGATMTKEVFLKKTIYGKEEEIRKQGIVSTPHEKQIIR